MLHRAKNLGREIEKRTDVNYVCIVINKIKLNIIPIWLDINVHLYPLKIFATPQFTSRQQNVIQYSHHSL